MAIETPSPEDTAQLLPSFTPFRIVPGSGSPTLPAQSPLLLLFKGNEKLEKPDGEPSEEVCLDGVMFSIYHREDSTWIAIGAMAWNMSCSPRQTKRVTTATCR